MVAPTIALANDFLEAFAYLPRAQQRKVREFTRKFKDNPTSAAINYEKIHGVRDDKVRTVRIDQQYRAVILQPKEGNVHVLVWVDNHDEAMKWAKNKVFEVNPATGALQVVNIAESTLSVPATADPDQDGKNVGGGRLFDGFDDPTLTSLGVPAVLLPAVRAVRGMDSLPALIRHLPAEAAEALVWLGEGIPVDEVRGTVAQPKKAGPVNTSDFATALDNPDSRRRFVKVTSQDELEAILDAPLEKWRIFLHPTQGELVGTHFNGPARVLGGAGTGKTVVAMHRARHLARDMFKGQGDKVLFTTFTANLAADVEQNLRGLCERECDRIEVVHLHAWAARFLRSAGQRFRIATDDDIRACWDAAAPPDLNPWPAGFLAREWGHVVQAQGIDNEAEYLAAVRSGRGQTLSQSQRAQVWRAFERFDAELRARGLLEWVGVVREARKRLNDAGAPPYRSVIVDEAQDLHPEDWRLIRALAAPGPNDLFIVGDAHQRIYAPKVTLSRCGIFVVGRSRKLKVNYRTTEQIRAWAVSVLSGESDDLDGGADGQSGYKSLLSGPAPRVQRFNTAQQEKKFLEKELGSLASKHGAENVCLVARTSRALGEYVPVLDQLMLPTVILDRSGSEAGGGVRLATMHRVKGLEFRCVVLAGVNANVLPLSGGDAGAQDPMTKAEHEARERSLLYVAATRARDELLVTTWGTPSPFIESLLASRPEP